MGRGDSGPPCPEASEPSQFLGRLEGLTLAYGRRRAQGAGAGRDLGFGRGQEFVGYRPYRPGEDARALDFSLLARLGKPFVRVMRPEAHTAVTILLDRSASMAVGPPGKWQSAVELALALGHLWGSVGARVRWLHGSNPGSIESLRMSRPVDAAACRRALFATRAEGGLGLRDLLTALGSGDDHVVLIGDLFDLQPRDLEPWLRARSHWSLVRVLGPVETAPPVGQAVVWLDPEDSRQRMVCDGGADRWSYLQALADQDEAWQSWCGRHRIGYHVHLAGTPFEDALLGRGPHQGLAL